MEFIKTYNKTAKVIIGGPFVFTQVRTQEPAVINYLFESIGADLYVCSSQGEATLVNILNALKNDLPLHRLNNIYYKSGSEYVATPFFTENNKLSENRIDWNLFSPRAGEYINVRTTISCPFSCSFCGFPQHAGAYQTTPVEEIEKELDQIARIPSLKGVSFIDDTFNVPPGRFKDILRMMKRKNYTFEWIANFRCQFADRETVELMKVCNCQGVFLGIESGNDQILKNMNKAASLEKHLNGVALLKEYGIMTFGSFIIGFPGETTETVQDTVKFIKESGINFFRAHLWYFEPITPIRRDREKYDLSGESFEWSHRTMDSKTASDLIDNIFLSAKNAIWVPQYNFDFDQLWHLMHRGMNMEQIKEFLKAFNSGIKEKLLNSSNSDASPGVIQRLKKACRRSGSPEDSGDEEMLVLEDYGATFNF
jgi:radical SAM PhpK family P-methyltransferase